MAEITKKVLAWHLYCFPDTGFYWYFPGLFGAMKATNMLNNSIASQIFYGDSLWYPELYPKATPGCHNLATYQVSDYM